MRNIAWVAGVFEGEGNIRLKKNRVGMKHYKQPTVQIHMCDEDVLREVQEITGLGKITGPYTPKNKNWTPTWQWSIQNRKGVKEFIEMVSPFLCSRRKEQTKIVLDEINRFES